MLADIEAAQTRIFFESYIWKGDGTGLAFRDALVRAHERGVEVFVAFDEFANLVVPRAFFRSLPAGIHVKRHPLLGRFPYVTPRQSGRNHRKLLVVDDASPTGAAYLGGYNIGSLYADRWRDTHARVSGEMVVELANAFVDYWNTAPGRSSPHLHQPHARTWSPTMRVHRNSPVDLVYPIRNMYLEAIDRAEHHIYLTAAYFIPDDVLTRALVEAVHRGVDVQIIVPHFSNHIVADWLSRASYAELLEGGVRILRYENAMVHAKTATVDGRWTTLGTANLDRLSLAGNYELNIEILDRDVARQMEEVFRADALNCNELTLGEWTGRPMIARVTEGLLAPYRPLL
jgi:cardiolipin synthase